MTRRASFVSHPRPRPDPAIEAEGKGIRASVQAEPGRPTHPRENKTQLGPGSPAQPRGLEALFVEVKALANHLRKPAMLGQPEGDLTDSGRSILQLLHHHGLQTVPQIARRLETSRQNVQVLVNRLQAESCIELIANPAHKRSRLVGLTSQGRTLVATVGDHQGELLENLSSRVSDADVLSAADLLNKLRQALGHHPDGLEPLPRKLRRPPATVRHSATPATQNLNLPQPLPFTAAQSEPATSELPVNLL